MRHFFLFYAYTIEPGKRGFEGLGKTEEATTEKLIAGVITMTAMTTGITYSTARSNTRLTDFHDLRSLVLQASVHQVARATRTQDFDMEKPLQFYF